MKDIYFWKVWSASERRLVISVFIVIFISLVFLLLKSIDPLGNTVQWNVLSEAHESTAVIDLIHLGQFQFGVTIPSQLISEQFIASVMETDFLSVAGFIILSLIGFSIILGALTTLPRFWYLASMLLVVFLIAATKLEMLYIFGQGSKVLLIITLLLFGGLSYYFHAFRPDLGIAQRVLGMLLVTIILTALVYFTSPILSVGLTFSSYSYPIWITLTAVFIMMVSTEFMANLVWLSTAGPVKKGNKGLLNFLIISLLYLLYLLLYYLQNTKQIDWNLTLIHPAYFLILGAITGIWGFRKRADATQGVLAYRPLGFWLYTGLFIIAGTFVAYAFATANDPALEAMEDLTIQGQLAMSLVFLVYILINFFEIFSKGLAVHKVLYKPLRMGLTQVRLFGFVGVIILFSIQRLLPFHQAIAGYFNGLGDLHTQTREFTIAEQYYQLAIQQEFQNHKSNYGLASLALKQGDRNAAAYYYRQALLKNPSPQAYAGLANVLIFENLFFDALHNLKEGIGVFPKNGELLNNLGILYSKTNVADSAYYFLEKSLKEVSNPAVSASNLLFVLAKNGNQSLLDSIKDSNKEYQTTSWQANKLAINNLRKDFNKTTFSPNTFSSDSLLSASSFAYLINYAQNQARNDSLPATLYPKLANYNPVLAIDLNLAALYSEFYSGNKLKALETIATWADESGEKQQLYKKVYGSWLLQLGLYHQSIEQFSEVEGVEGTIGLAIANAQLGNEAIAGVLIDKLQNVQPNPTLEKLLETFDKKAIIKMPFDSLRNIAEKSPSTFSFDNALRANPFDEKTVAEAAVWYRKQKQTKKAYQIVINALRYNETSPIIWEQYTYLNLEQGLLTQASDGAQKVKEFANDAVYQSFIERYQAMRTLIEKQRAEF